MDTRLLDAVTAWEDARGHPLIIFAESDHSSSTKFIDARDTDIIRRILRTVGNSAVIDLLIAGPGGNVSAATRIGELVRRSARHLTVLLPHRARSAHTLPALAADEIIFGCGGELGPVDAVMRSAASGAVGGLDAASPPTISSRDLASFGAMAAEWFGQTGDIATGLDQLCARVFPVNLSQLHRAENHVRWAAQHLMPADGSRSTEQHAAIVEQLITGYHSHDAVIDGREAALIGLPARDASATEATLLYAIWDLLEVEFAAAAPVLQPDSVIAVAASRHRFAQYGFGSSPADACNSGELLLRWTAGQWPHKTDHPLR